MNRVLPAQGGKRGVLEALAELDDRPPGKFPADFKKRFLSNQVLIA